MSFSMSGAFKYLLLLITTFFRFQLRLALAHAMSYASYRFQNYYDQTTIYWTLICIYMHIANGRDL